MSVGNRHLIPGGEALQSANLELQSAQRQPVFVGRLGASYLSLGLLQLRLAQFDDGTKTKLVACLCKVNAKVCLLQKLATR